MSASPIKINVTSDREDYTAGDYPVIFQAGFTKENFSIPIVDDDIVELDETFFLTLVIPQSAQDIGVMRGDPFMATVTIINDDGECSVTTLPLTTPTDSSPPRIHCCIHPLLGPRAVETTFASSFIFIYCTSLLRLSCIYAMIVRNCNNIPFEPWL